MPSNIAKHPDRRTALRDVHFAAVQLAVAVLANRAFRECVGLRKGLLQQVHPSRFHNDPKTREYTMDGAVHNFEYATKIISIGLTKLSSSTPSKTASSVDTCAKPDIHICSGLRFLAVRRGW